MLYSAKLCSSGWILRRRLGGGGAFVFVFCKTVPKHICSINSNPTVVFLTWCHTCPCFICFGPVTIVEVVVVAVGCLEWVC